MDREDSKGGDTGNEFVGGVRDEFFAKEDLGDSWFPECEEPVFATASHSLNEEWLQAHTAQRLALLEPLSLWSQLVDRFDPNYRLASKSSGTRVFASAGGNAFVVLHGQRISYCALDNKLLVAQVDAPRASYSSCVWGDGWFVAAGEQSMSSFRVDDAGQVHKVNSFESEHPIADVACRVCSVSKKSQLLVLRVNGAVISFLVDSGGGLSSHDLRFELPSVGIAQSLTLASRFDVAHNRFPPDLTGKPGQVYFWREVDADGSNRVEKDFDVAYVAADSRVFMLSIRDQAPFTRIVTTFELGSNRSERPWLCRRRGISSLVCAGDAIVQIALSPSRKYLASLRKKGSIFVQYSGLKFPSEGSGSEGVATEAQYGELGHSVILARGTDPAQLCVPVMISWWEESGLLVTFSNGLVKLLFVDEKRHSEGAPTDEVVLLEAAPAPAPSPWARATAVAKRVVNDKLRVYALAIDVEQAWIPDDRAPDGNYRVWRDHRLLSKLSALGIRECTPKEYVTYLTAKQAFGEAHDVCSRFGVDPSPVWKAQWLQGPASEETISTYLSHVRDDHWVLSQCVSRVPLGEGSTRALLNHGIERLGSLPNPTDIDEQRGERLRDILLRLDLFCRLHDGELQPFNPIEFSSFRSCDLVELVRDYSRRGNIFAVEAVLRATPHSTVPLIKELLSLLPETTPPVDYEHLLPSFGLDSRNYYVLKGGNTVLFDDRFSPDADARLFSIESTLRWYCQRIIEIDKRSGFLDYAKQLGDCAMERVRASLAPMPADLLPLRAFHEVYGSLTTLNRLVYRCGLSDTLSLEQWACLGGLEQLRLMGQDATMSSAVEVFSSRFVPIIRDAEPSVVTKWLHCLRNYMMERCGGSANVKPSVDLEQAEEGLLVCAEIIHQSRPGFLESKDRIIPLPQALIEVSLACVYASPCTSSDARCAMDKIFESLPERQPSLEASFPALAALQDRVETLDGHLYVNAELARFDLVQPVRFYLNCCEQYEIREASHIASPSGIESKTREASHSRLSRRDSVNGDPASTDDPGEALILSLYKRAMHLNSSWADSERFDKWKHVVHLAWDVKEKALPYLSRNFCLERQLLTLLRAAQFQLAHELIESLKLEHARPLGGADDDACFGREKVENLVVRVAREYFNSASDYSRDEIDLARRTINALPFAPSRRAKQELQLVQVVDMLSNDLNVPIIPIEARLFLESKSLMGIFDYVFEHNPRAYKCEKDKERDGPFAAKHDAKLLKLGAFVGLDKLQHKAEIRKRIVAAALSQGDMDVAQGVCDAMLENVYFLGQQPDVYDVDVLRQVESHTAEACLGLAQAAGVSDHARYLAEAMKLAGEEDICSAWELFDPGSQGACETESAYEVDWSSIFDPSCMSLVRHKARCFLLNGDDEGFTRWAVAEVVFFEDVAKVAIAVAACRMLQNQSEGMLDAMLRGISYFKELLHSRQMEHVESTLTRALVSAVGVALKSTLEQEQPILESFSAASSALSYLQDHLSDAPPFAQAFISDLCQDAVHTVHGETLEDLLPGVDLARFAKDAEYRTSQVNQVVLTLGSTLSKASGQSETWTRLLDVAETYEIPVASLEERYITGALTTTSGKVTDSEIAKKLKLLSLIKASNAETLRILGMKVYQQIPGTWYKRLIVLESLIADCVIHGNFQVVDDSEVKRVFKKRRSAFVKLAKLRPSTLDSKLVLEHPILRLRQLVADGDSLRKWAASVESVSREKAVAHLVDCMTESGLVIDMCSLGAKLVETEPKLRASELLLHYLLRTMSLDSAQDESVDAASVTVPKEVSRSNRQLYKTKCAPYISKLVAKDALAFIDAAVLHGRTLASLDLDLRERILEDCSTSIGDDSNAAEYTSLEAVKNVVKALRFLFGCLEACPFRLPADFLPHFIAHFEEASVCTTSTRKLLATASVDPTVDALFVVELCLLLNLSPEELFSSSFAETVVEAPQGVIDKIVSLLATADIEATHPSGVDSDRLEEKAHRCAAVLKTLVRDFIASSECGAKQKVLLLERLGEAGMAKDGDSDLIVASASLHVIAEFWESTKVSGLTASEFRSASSRRQLLEELGEPTSSEGLFELLSIWDSCRDLGALDLGTAQRLHASFCLESLLAPELSQRETRGEALLSPFHVEWLRCFRGLVQERQSIDSILVRYSETTLLLTEREERELVLVVQNCLSSELSIQLGLFSPYPSVRQVAQEQWLSEVDPDNGTLCDNDILRLILSTCPIQIWWDSTGSLMVDECLRIQVDMRSLDPCPFTWSPYYIVLALTLERRLVDAGNTFLKICNVHNKLRVAGAWICGLRWILLRCASIKSEDVGWKNCSVLAHTALGVLNQEIMVRSDEASVVTDRSRRDTMNEFDGQDESGMRHMSSAGDEERFEVASGGGVLSSTLETNSDKNADSGDAWPIDEDWGVGEREVESAWSVEEDLGLDSAEVETQEPPLKHSVVVREETESSSRMPQSKVGVDSTEVVPRKESESAWSVEEDLDLDSAEVETQEPPLKHSVVVREETESSNCMPQSKVGVDSTEVVPRKESESAWSVEEDLGLDSAEVETQEPPLKHSVVMREETESSNRMPQSKVGVDSTEVVPRKESESAWSVEEDLDLDSAEVETQEPPLKHSVVVHEEIESSNRMPQSKVGVDSTEVVPRKESESAWSVEEDLGLDSAEVEAQEPPLKHSVVMREEIESSNCMPQSKVGVDSTEVVPRKESESAWSVEEDLDLDSAEVETQEPPLKHSVVMREETESSNRMPQSKVGVDSIEVVPRKESESAWSVEEDLDLDSTEVVPRKESESAWSVEEDLGLDSAEVETQEPPLKHSVVMREETESSSRMPQSKVGVDSTEVVPRKESESAWSVEEDLGLDSAEVETQEPPLKHSVVVREETESSSRMPQSKVGVDSTEVVPRKESESAWSVEEDLGLDSAEVETQEPPLKHSVVMREEIESSNCMPQSKVGVDSTEVVPRKESESAWSVEEDLDLDSAEVETQEPPLKHSVVVREETESSSRMPQSKVGVDSTEVVPRKESESAWSVEEDLGLDSAEVEAQKTHTERSAGTLESAAGKEDSLDKIRVAETPSALRREPKVLSQALEDAPSLNEIRNLPLFGKTGLSSCGDGMSFDDEGVHDDTCQDTSARLASTITTTVNSPETRHSEGGWSASVDDSLSLDENITEPRIRGEVGEDVLQGHGRDLNGSALLSATLGMKREEAEPELNLVSNESMAVGAVDAHDLNKGAEDDMEEGWSDDALDL